MKLFIAHGYDINSVPLNASNNENAVYLACKENHFEIVSYLVNVVGYAFPKNSNLFYLTLATENVKLINFVIKHGQSFCYVSESDEETEPFFTPGKYKVINAVFSTNEIEKQRKWNDVLYYPGTVVDIRHVVTYPKENRICGRLKNCKWVSIFELDTKKQFLKNVKKRMKKNF